MLKRALVLLDETPSSASARTYAFALAQKIGASLTGLAGIDLSFIEDRMPGVAGGTAWKFWLEDRLKAQADQIRHRLRETFERECALHNTPFEWLSFEGDPVETLHMAAETRDLIITGHDTTFRGNRREQLSDILSHLLLTTPRPLIVGPDVLPSGEEIMIAYDGSLPSMRSVQLFTLLGLGRGRRIHVTAIDVSQEVAARTVSGAIGYLRNHGYEVEANPITSDNHPSDVLPIEIHERRIGTLVMGAFGHRGLREYLFGSTTNALVEDPRCALFIYH